LGCINEFQRLFTRKTVGGKTEMECMECGHKFKKKLSKNTATVKCPKCKGYDVDIA
jgi:Zn finger protein HypA/HybF involved in hydrogenase expression